MRYSRSTTLGDAAVSAGSVPNFEGGAPTGPAQDRSLTQLLGRAGLQTRLAQDRPAPWPVEPATEDMSIMSDREQEVRA